MGVSRRSYFAPGSGGRLLARLSNAANHSKLWVGLAALMALAGGRRGRRAGQRGLMAIAGASTLTNGLLKPLLPRPRPLQPEIRAYPWVRLPRSSSFPSGHAASAAAFATAVMIEAPLLGLPVAALAAAVGWSRVTTGVHHPSDVVVGAAVGAAVAATTTKAWPRIDHTPAGAVASPALTQVAGAVSPTGSGLTVVVNAAAGPSAHDHDLATIETELPDATIVRVDQVADIDDALRQAASSCRTLGVLGGDGTINAAANAATEHGVALAVFPGGTLNHFARDLGLDSVHDAITAIQEGQLVSVDTASIDGHVFLNTASFGSYSEFVTAREKLEGRIGKPAAAVVAMCSVLRNGRRFEMTLDGVRRKTWMVFIGNCAYDPPGFAPATRCRLDDGLLDVRIVDATARAARLRLVAALVTGGLARSPIYSRQLVAQASVSTRRSTARLAADGEVFTGNGTFDIAKSQRSLHVHAPHA